VRYSHSVFFQYYIWVFKQHSLIFNLNISQSRSDREGYFRIFRSPSLRSANFLFLVRTTILWFASARPEDGDCQFSNFLQWQYYLKLKDFGQDFLKKPGGFKQFWKYFWGEIWKFTWRHIRPECNVKTNKEPTDWFVIRWILY